jgi:hypothetical protein
MIAAMTRCAAAVERLGQMELVDVAAGRTARKVFKQSIAFAATKRFLID